MKAKYIGLILLAGTVLAGCGGGSSSSSGPQGSTVSKVSINSTNQSTITNAAIESATQSLTAGALDSVGGVQISSAPLNDRILNNLADFAFKKIAENRNAPLSVSGAVVATYTCTTSGNITFDTDGSNTTAPTYFTIAYNNCVESGITQNGTVSLSSLLITPSTGTPTSISASFAFNYTISNASNSAGIYGGFTIAASGIGSANRNDSISGTSLNFKYGSQYETLSNFAFVSTYNDTITPHGYSDTVNYTFASDVILAGFDFSTISPLVRNVGDVKPRSGQVIIAGASNTKLRVTVLPYDAATNTGAGTMSGKVTLELDQGTGLGYGAAVTKTWTQLATNT